MDKSIGGFTVSVLVDEFRHWNAKQPKSQTAGSELQNHITHIL